MKTFIVITLFTSLVICGCTNKKPDSNVVFDTTFLGARLDSFTSVENNKYVAYINPAFEPVNKSPWYAFGVISKSKKNIEVVLNYGKYEHRYIPKLSTDKKSWKKIKKSNIKIDSISRTATLKLEVSPQKLYVAAQELETSKDTYAWLDSILQIRPFLSKQVAGKTVNGQNNYVVSGNSNLKEAIVIIARQHPPEIPGGTIAFKAFFEELTNNSELSESFRKKYNIIAFPLLNPDGVDMGNWRHNAAGVDLNRDWINFTQPETQTVKSYVESLIKKGVNIEFSLDFHTSHSGPYMLVLDEENAQKTKGIISQWIYNIEKNSEFKVEVRRRSQDLPYCYNYFFNQIGCEAVTYEDGDEIDRDIIKERARVYAQQLMKTML